MGSAAETMESAYAIKYNTAPPVLSPQEIIECDGKYAGTCELEGDFWSAWEKVQQNGGLASVDDYPITCCDGRWPAGPITTCQNKPSKVKVIGMHPGPTDERGLAAAVASDGPYSV